VLGLNDERSRQKLSVADVDKVMSVEVLAEEIFVLSEIPSPLVGHLRQPDILPHCHVVALHVLQEQPDVHEEVDIAGLLYLIILLRVHHKDLVLRVLSWKDVHLCVVKRGLDDVQLEGRKGRQSEVTYLPYLPLVVCLDRQRGSLEVERQVEGLVKLCVVDSVQFSLGVFAVPNDLFALAHQSHVELYQIFVFVEFQFFKFQFLLLHADD
jgi:hypothetical protein